MDAQLDLGLHQNHMSADLIHLWPPHTFCSAQELRRQGATPQLPLLPSVQTRELRPPSLHRGPQETDHFLEVAASRCVLGSKFPAEPRWKVRKVISKASVVETEGNAQGGDKAQNQCGVEGEAQRRDSTGGRSEVGWGREKVGSE